MNERTPRINIGKATAIRVLRSKVKELSRTIDELGEPLLTDLSLLPCVYDAYRRVFERRGRPGDAATVRNRKKFLLVALYLYSPKTLAGERMRRGGLRRAITALFGLTASTPVSDNCSGLVVQYRAYADFRRDVDIIFEEVCRSLPPDSFIDRD